jgi:quinol monooxygenase YgiN
MEKINKLQINTFMKIPKGKLKLFKQLAAESIRLTSERDTGFIKQDWFISNDQTEGVIREEYKNSEAVLEHMVNMSEIRELANNFSINHVNVYGAPSPELLEMTKGVNMRVYSYSLGLEEMIEA